MKEPKGLPLCKWPGGKRGVASALIERFPKTFTRYVEPFCGAAALFFALKPPKAILSDTNQELITTLQVVRDQPSLLCEALAQRINDESTYYAVRQHRPTSQVEVAARFLYLTQLSFNGIYRVNSQGTFNVPYGHKYHLPVFSRAHIFACSSTLKEVELLCADFRYHTDSIGTGDVVYLDPPYVTNHNNNGFIKYNEKLFRWQDQIELAEFAKHSVQSGATVLVSNAAHDDVIALYEGFQIELIKQYSSVSALSKGRTDREEVFLIGNP